MALFYENGRYDVWYEKIAEKSREKEADWQFNQIRWLRPRNPWREFLKTNLFMASQTPLVKNPPEKAGDARDKGSIPGLCRYPWVGNDHLLQDPCLENSTNRGAHVGYGPWGRKELDTTEHSTHAQTCLWRGAQSQTSLPSPHKILSESL